MINYVHTDGAPAPRGHYAQGITFGELIFVSGQLPISPDGTAGEKGDIESQARQVLDNVSAVLSAAGSGLDKVLKATVYISDIQNWTIVDQVYKEYFGKHTPARAVVPTRELHFGYQIEMEVIAVK